MDGNKTQEKLDTIIEKINNIEVILAKQHVSLDDHMRRTEILEEEILPLKNKYFELRGMIKLGGLIVGLLSVAAAVAEILGYIKNVR